MGPIANPDNILPGAIDLRQSLNIQVLIDGVPVTPQQGETGHSASP